MSGNLKYLLYNIHSINSLYAGDRRLFSLLRKLQTETGFQVNSIPLDKVFQSVEKQDHESFVGAWEALKGKSRPTGVVIDLNDEKGFEISIGIESSLNPWIYLFFEDSLLSRSNERSREIVMSIINISELIYTELRPEYGFGMVAPYKFSFVDLNKRPPTISAIHDFNLLSPSLVYEIGIDLLEAIPSWKKIRFHDGGIFIIMSPNPIAEWEEYEASYREAADILDVDEVYQGG